jgi:hypothetical protein
MKLIAVVMPEANSEGLNLLLIVNLLVLWVSHRSCLVHEHQDHRSQVLKNLYIIYINLPIIRKIGLLKRGLDKIGLNLAQYPAQNKKPVVGFFANPSIALDDPD